ncbi:hypothetical protein PENANT_c056G04789 [Penicillium antarcticum]|uniref:Uncharacterized protein n=1 Tax=Penicillium antarcticum TaxID=416450 RepID=A0A1V6PRB0_9EURO|nr:hypothetical protein PENANT_c056G04789 [Penicillium antarcticum]
MSIMRATVLICLAIVFAGCTSPFTPFNLYFMKVDLSNFPRIDDAIARRSLDTVGTRLLNHTNSMQLAARSAGEGAQKHLARGAGSAVGQVSNDLGTLLNNIKADLPAYYHVGLLSYCQGRDGILNKCSDTSTSFSFNLWGIFKSLASEMNGLSASDGEVYITGNLHSSRAIICLYISAYVAAFLTLVFGVKRVFVSHGSALLVVSSITSTILLTVATSWSISLYYVYTQHIEEVLGKYGAKASLGTHTIVSTSERKQQWPNLTLQTYDYICYTEGQNYWNIIKAY